MPPMQMIGSRRVRVVPAGSFSFVPVASLSAAPFSAPALPGGLPSVVVSRVVSEPGVPPVVAPATVGTLAVVPLAVVPLAVVPLAVVPLAVVPLAVVPAVVPLPVVPFSTAGVSFFSFSISNPEAPGFGAAEVTPFSEAPPDEPLPVERFPVAAVFAGSLLRAVLAGAGPAEGVVFDAAPRLAAGAAVTLTASRTPPGSSRYTTVIL
jgi:hypothetical protein